MAEVFDGRRRRYVPLDVHFAFGRFGTKLLEQFGMEGLCTWTLFLAACKREVTEGTFTYTTDLEAWGKLGAIPTNGMTLEDFWRFTGQHKKTSRRRHGRVSYIVCTSWGDWNKPRGAAQNPRSAAQNTEKKQKEYEPIATTEVEVDLEVESESEETLKSDAGKPKLELVPFTGELAKAVKAPWRDVYDHWRTTRERTRSNYERPSPKRMKLINDRLKKFTPDDLKRAIDGIGCDPWLDRHLHDDLTIVFRNDEQVERFIEFEARRPVAASNGFTVSADALLATAHVNRLEEISDAS